MSVKINGDNDADIFALVYGFGIATWIPKNCR
jgi:hypothetical protein